MQQEPLLSRRQLLARAATLAAGVGVAASGLAGCAAGAADRGLVFVNLDQAVAELERLSAAPALFTSEPWSWPQTLLHCARSIEYSVLGYPRLKPEWFQQTLGAAAFRLFAWRQRMFHDRSEEIPGAATLNPSVDAAVAKARLLSAITQFRNQTELQPHFAYGPLNKAAYEQAHAMHLADHFSAFHLAG